MTDPDPGEALRQARSEFQAGRRARARRLACQILDVAPEHAAAWHLLAMIAFQEGHHARAIELARRAIQLEPAKEIYYTDLASIYQELNQLEAAIVCHRRVLELNPLRVESHAHLGFLFQELAQFDDAIAHYRKALTHTPAWAALHVNLGLALTARGQLAEALRSFEAAARIEPELAEAHFNLANAQRAQGLRAAAEASYRRALAGRPDYAQALNNLGLMLLERGAIDEAEQSFRRVLAIAPEHFEAHNNLGMTLQRQGRIEQAEGCYRRALAINPEVAHAHSNLATALTARGALAEAIQSCHRALELAPGSAEAYQSLGNALRDQGQLAEAAAAYQQALRAKPRNAMIHVSLGALFQAQGRLRDALQCYEAALAIDPDLVEAHVNIGNILFLHGRLADALDAYAQSMRIRPDYADAYSNYLFSLNFDPTKSDADLSDAHRDWGARHGRQAPGHGADRTAREPEKVLRVGLVSADFGRHPVGYFLDPLLTNADATQAELVCYSGRSKADDLTTRLRALASGWRCTRRCSDQELAAMIRADGIDILVDLAGHTAGNRLGCFALRTAPVQIHWAGYCHSVSVVDYSLWDAIQVPAGEERWFAETVVRLPDLRWCYAPPHYAPGVTEPPMFRRGFVTFGSFNNLAKVNAGVIDLWARVMAALPDSRLMLNWRTLSDPEERERLTAAFARRGIAPARLDLRPGADNHAGVLAEYSEVDIALDPFPFTGCLTTCEALWMGLPVITLDGTRPASRQTKAFLTAIGRTEWVAQTTNAYLRIAAGLASAPDRLASLRSEQRARITASPMGDGARFARNFEAALREIWRSRCG